MTRALLVVTSILIGCRAGGEARPAPPRPAPVPAGYSLSPMTIVAADEKDPDELVVDDTHVWWGAGADLRRATRTGGPAETFAAGLGPIEAVAGDATRVYVATAGDGYGAPLGSGRLIAIAKQGGAQTVLATGLTAPGDVVVDGDTVYYSHATSGIDFDVETGQVLAVPATGGPARVVADRQATPHRLALDATHVYFTNYGGPASLNRVPRAGGAVEVLAREQGTPTCLALAGDHVYVGTMSGAIGLWRVARTGGPVQRVLDATSEALVVAGDAMVVRTDAGLIVAVPLAGGPMRALAFDRALAFEPLAVAGDTLYWSSRNDGTVKRTRLPGGHLVLAPAIRDTAGAVATDAVAAYYLDTDNGYHGDVYTTPTPDLVIRVPLGGGEASVLWATGAEEELSALAVDATHVYVADEDGGRILRLDKRRRSGRPAAAPVVIASGLQAPTALAVDATHVYFAQAKDGVVGRVPLAGGAVEILATRGAGVISALALRPDGVLWAERDAVLRLPAAGGPVEAVVRFAAPLEALAFDPDAQRLYALSSTGDAASVLVEVTLADGSTRPVAAPSGAYGGLAVLGDGLVYSSDTYQAVLRMSLL